MPFIVYSPVNIIHDSVSKQRLPQNQVLGYSEEVLMNARILRIGCIACLKCQPFDMKKEKKTTVFILIIAPIPKDNPSLLCLYFIFEVNKVLYIIQPKFLLDDYQN